MNEKKILEIYAKQFEQKTYPKQNLLGEGGSYICGMIKKFSTLRNLHLHNNTPAHTSQIAMAATTDCGFEIFHHFQYSSMSYLRNKIESSILKG
jgi:hypothetical protein